METKIPHGFQPFYKTTKGSLVVAHFNSVLNLYDRTKLVNGDIEDVKNSLCCDMQSSNPMDRIMAAETSRIIKATLIG